MGEVVKAEPIVKRGPGRPRKHDKVDISTASNPENINAAVAERNELVAEVRRNTDEKYFNPRLKKLASIAEQNTPSTGENVKSVDEWLGRATEEVEEFVKPGDSGVDYKSLTPEQLEALANGEDVVVEESAPQNRVTLTINGERITKTREEWAAEVTKAAPGPAPVVTRQPVVEAVIDTPVDRNALKELAKAIQGGTEEEAAEALVKFNEISESRARLAARKAHQSQQLGIIFESIVEANQPLAYTKDDKGNRTTTIWFKLARQFEQELLAKMFDQNDALNDFRLRYTEAWRLARAEHDKVIKTTAQNTELAALDARKRALLSAPGSTTRGANQPTGERQLTESEANAKAIAATRNRRDALRKANIR